MKYAWYDLGGNLGVAMMILAYLLLQMGKLRVDQPLYSVINAVGAGLVLISLAYSFNLSAVLVEGFWLAISIFGLIKYFFRTRAAS